MLRIAKAAIPVAKAIPVLTAIPVAKAEIEEKIDLILDQERINRNKSITLKQSATALDRVSLQSGGITIDPKFLIINYPNFVLLIKLFNTLSDESKSYFINHLLKFWDDEKVGSLITETLIKTNNFDRIIPIIAPQFKGKLYFLLFTIDELLTYEYTIFSKTQLKILKYRLSALFSLKSIDYENFSFNTYYRERGIIALSLKRIHTISYRALVKELDEHTNYEINSDIKEIKYKIKLFNFDEIFIEAINKIEKMYSDVSIDEFDNSMALNELRNLLHEIIKLFCEKIKEKTGKEYPNTEKTDIANYRLYMKKHLELDEEHALLNNLVKILNHEGSHSFITERQYFRLTKNITIEIIMLLLYKFEQFSAK